MNSSKLYCITCGQELTIGNINGYKGARCNKCNSNYNLTFMGEDKITLAEITYFANEPWYKRRVCK